MEKLDRVLRDSLHIMHNSLSFAPLFSAIRSILSRLKGKRQRASDLAGEAYSKLLVVSKNSQNK